MATLILAAAGTAVAGPIGGAIGAVLGQQVDNRLFAPRARHGPRLGELAVQTSSYGTAIPKIFGTMRVAGTVVWATDLREERSSSGGGKGRPKTVDYSYSASFAVALSGRPILGVGRIWADGKLLRGAAGDFKSATGYRLHLGGEAQAVDPLIASAEGAGQAPAYRGLAYAVFEDFQLADYGNRIPSLSFEVEADEGAVAIGAIAEQLSGGEVRAGETPALGGYAASGDSVRGAVEALGEVVPMSLVEEDGHLVLTLARAPEPPVILEAEAGAGGRTEMLRQAAGSLPAEVGIAYHDPARDYQTGLQRATTAGASAAALRSDRRALPAALGADAAKALAEYRLASLWAGRATAKLRLAWRRSGLRPGAHVRIEGAAGLWRVSHWTLERMATALALVRVPGAGPPTVSGASPGRPIGHVDRPHGPTTLRILDLPLGGEQRRDGPDLLVAAAGAEEGWRRAELIASYDGGASWQAAGSTAGAAVMGEAVGALAPGGPALFDGTSSVEVELLNDSMWLESRDDAALAGGANLAAIGDELIQFGAAEPLGERRFRLSRLLRGRRGTEWAAATHEAGEAFVMIEPDRLAALEAPAAVLGGEARLVGSGIGDGPEGAEAIRAVTGEAMRPPAPVHLAAEALAGGDLAIRWVRRSRNGWAWLGGADAPLGEESERYRLTLAAAGFERNVELTEPGYVYTSAQQLEDGPAEPLTVRVVQVGTLAASRPAEIGID
jgi:putative tail protein